MKILLISNVFPPGFIGGYELGAFEIGRELAARGHQVSVLTSDYLNEELNVPGISVERVLDCDFVSHQIPPHSDRPAVGPYVNYANLRRLGSALRRARPDLVLLFNLMGLGALGMIEFVRKCQIPSILYLMDNIFPTIDTTSPAYRSYASIFGAPCFTSPAKIVAMSRNLVEDIDRTMGTALVDVTFIPGWVDLRVQGAAPLLEDRGSPARFVFCSRIDERKGIQYVLDAAQQLVQSGAPAFTVDVYGAGAVARLLQDVRAKGLDRHIRYAGCRPKEEMLTLFREYEALLFPTREQEAFGFVVAEAAAAGCLPIMTAGIGAGEWFVSDLDCLKIARTGDALAAAMLRFMSMEPEARLTIRRAAMRAARRNLAFPRWMDVIERTCLGHAALGKPGDARELSRGVEAAFLFLSQLWSDSLESVRN